ncbi:MAG: hypothetical protein IMF16_05235 [Proteobacteria bacterium]|nr:hypothetical protein [Pseudomonadota bacterium]
MLTMSMAGCRKPDEPPRVPLSAEESTASPSARVDAPGPQPLVSITPTGDSVLLAFMYDKWGVSNPPVAFLSSGEKLSVDTDLGTRLSFRESTPHAWHVLGDGLYVRDYLDRPGAEFYRDQTDVRLIALVGPYLGCDTMIVSAESRHVAQLLQEHLVSLRTTSGVGLGDSAHCVLELLGRPSHRNRFGAYDILWYLQQPKRWPIHVGSRKGQVDLTGRATAYALKDDEVVEIWLHTWSTAPTP